MTDCRHSNSQTARFGLRGDAIAVGDPPTLRLPVTQPVRLRRILVAYPDQRIHRDALQIIDETTDHRRQRRWDGRLQPAQTRRGSDIWWRGRLRAPWRCQE